LASFDDARVLLQHHLAAEDLGVERAGASNAPYGDELGDEDALRRGGQVLVVDERLMLVCFAGAHGDLLVALGNTSIGLRVVRL
jgi:hypothetical protein